MTKFRVSQSKVKTYRRCAEQYHLKYVEKLRRRRVGRPLQFGKLLHGMIEAHVEKQDPFQVLIDAEKEQGKMFRAEVEMYGEILEDLRDIFEAYIERWKDDGLRWVKRKGQRSEHKFMIEIAPDIDMVAYLDGIVVDRSRLRWLAEHKSFKKEPNDDDRWRNLQSVSYIRIMEMAGLPSVDGTMWNYVRSKAPGVPQVNKDETLSRRRFVTLPGRLARFFEENGYDSEAYPEMVAQAEEDLETYFFRVFTPIKKDVVDRVFDDLVETAVEMSERHGKRRSRNIDQHCSWCDFEPLCRGELQGSDTDYIKEKEYYVSDYKEDDAEEIRLEEARLKEADEAP